MARKKAQADPTMACPLAESLSEDLLYPIGGPSRVSQFTSEPQGVRPNARSGEARHITGGMLV